MIQWFCSIYECYMLYIYFFFPGTINRKTRWNGSQVWFISHIHLLKSPQKTFGKVEAHSKILGGWLGKTIVLSHSKQTNLHFYCQFNQLSTAWGIVLVRRTTLDTHHSPIVSHDALRCLNWHSAPFSHFLSHSPCNCYIRDWCSLAESVHRF